jgi:hypothetical protein
VPCTLPSHLETIGHVHQKFHRNVEYSCSSATYHILLPEYLIRHSNTNFAFTVKNLSLCISERLDRVLHRCTHSNYLPTETRLSSLRTANATNWTRSRASRATPGIDLEGDWAPTFGAERGSVDLPIRICVVPGLLGEVRF